MIKLLAAVSSDAFDSPAAFGLAGAAVLAVFAHLRRRRDHRAVSGR